MTVHLSTQDCEKDSVGTGTDPVCECYSTVESNSESVCLNISAPWRETQRTAGTVSLLCINSAQVWSKHYVHTRKLRDNKCTQKYQFAYKVCKFILFEFFPFFFLDVLMNNAILKGNDGTVHSWEKKREKILLTVVRQP